MITRPLKNGNLCSSSRKAKISTTGIYGIFRGLKFEPDAEIGHKVPFRSLRLSAKVSSSSGLNWKARLLLRGKEVKSSSIKLPF